MTSPAPESSTPKCPNCGATDHHRDIGSDCAPASCSEVVERLAKECCWITYGGHWTFDRADAEKILHSWRERRVQELEEAIREAAGRFYLCAKRLRESRSEGWASDADNWGDKLADTADALKSDEWREQIRKGAKHD